MFLPRQGTPSSHLWWYSNEDAGDLGHASLPGFVVQVPFAFKWRLFLIHRILCCRVH